MHYSSIKIENQIFFFSISTERKVNLKRMKVSICRSYIEMLHIYRQDRTIPIDKNPYHLPYIKEGLGIIER